MAPNSSTLAWKIPWTEEPGRLWSMGSRRVTWLNDFSFTFHFHALEKEMATHSSVLAWRIPRTGEPGGLTSMGSHRVRHDWSDLATAVYIWWYYFWHSSHSLPPQLCLQVCSLHLHLHSFPANRFINTFFLDSIQMHYIWHLFSLSDLLQSRFIHLTRTDSNSSLMTE